MNDEIGVVFLFSETSEQRFFNGFNFAGAKFSRAAPAKLKGVRNDSNKNQLVKMSHRPLKARGVFCRAHATRFVS